MSLWSRVSALRARRTYINIQFLSALSISGRAPLAPRFVIFRFLVFPFFFDPYFRRVYDFFLRRKHLESLVRVIRRFGVRMCATKAKKFTA